MDSLKRIFQRLRPVSGKGNEPVVANDIVDNVVKQIDESLGRLPPDEALRLLFRIEDALYVRQGWKAIEYGGGVHTKHRHMRYHDFFVERIRPGERVLDIGCGPGTLAHDIATRTGASVVGVDISERSIAVARQRFAHPGVQYEVSDVRSSLPTGRFDVVVLSNVLEHLPDRPQLLRSLQSRAEPHRFLIRVPLLDRDWRVPLKQELGVEWRLDATHETEYTHESFAGDMAAAGLKITHKEVRWSEIWAEAKPDA